MSVGLTHQPGTSNRAQKRKDRAGRVARTKTLADLLRHWRTEKGFNTAQAGEALGMQRWRDLATLSIATWKWQLERAQAD